MDVSGTHGLSCKNRPGKNSKHSIINDTADIQLARFSIYDEKHLDGLTLILCKLGKFTFWYVITAETTDMSYISVTSQSAGNAAKLAANKNRDKYVDLSKNYLFLPIAMKSLRPFCSEVMTFLKELGRRMTIANDGIRETAFSVSDAFSCSATF